MLPTRPVVAFDLDLTLVDTTPAVAAVLRAVATDLAVDVDVELALAHLGPPLVELLSTQVSREDAERLTASYRTHYVTHGPRHALVLPGAVEAVAAVRAVGGTAAVVTGQPRDSAIAHLATAALEIDVVVGGVWGGGKRDVLARLGAHVYVGDHPDDVDAARDAGALALAVTTGRHDAAALGAADLVLPSLHDVAAWIAGR